MKEAHTRVILGINWSHDDLYFATASKEKTKSIKVWSGLQKEEGKDLGILESELPDDNPVATAIRFFPSSVKGSYALLVGLECGDINLWHLSGAKEWTRLLKFPQYYSHTLAVKRMKFNNHG